MKKESSSNKLEPCLRFPEFNNNWTPTKLSKLLKFQNGINSSKVLYGSGYKLISVSDILDESPITYDSIRNYINISESLLKHYDVSYGDILFQRSSENYEDAGTANVYIDTKSATFGGFVIRGKKIGEYNPFFLNYLLKNNKYRKQIIRLAQGAQHINIGQDVLNNLLVYLPSDLEQSKIANMISAIDKYYVFQKNKLLLLKKYKRGLFNSIYDQKICFHNDDGSNYSVWDKCTLGSCTRQTTIRNKNNLNLRVYSVNNLEGFVPQTVQFEDREIASLDKKNYKIVSKNQFAYNPSRINVGSINYLKEDKKVIVSPLYVVFECNKSLHPGYLNEFVKTYEFAKQRRINTEGSVRDSLSYEGFSNIEIKLPSIEEQEKIVTVMNFLNEELRKQESQLKNIIEYKKALLQQMFI